MLKPTTTPIGNAPNEGSHGRWPSDLVDSRMPAALISHRPSLSHSLPSLCVLSPTCCVCSLVRCLRSLARCVCSLTRLTWLLPSRSHSTQSRRPERPRPPVQTRRSARVTPTATVGRRRRRVARVWAARRRAAQRHRRRRLWLPAAWAPTPHCWMWATVSYIAASTIGEWWWESTASANNRRHGGVRTASMR